MNTALGSRLRMNAGLMVALLFIPLGLGTFGVGIHCYRASASFLSRSVVTEGRVVGMQRMGPKEAPIVSFATRDGRELEFNSGSYASPPQYAVGDRTTVRYLPDAPEDARVDGWVNNWFTSTILLGLGSMLLLAGIGAGALGWKLARKESSLEARPSGP